MIYSAVLGLKSWNNVLAKLGFMRMLILFWGWSGESRVKYYTEMKIYGHPKDDLGVKIRSSGGNFWRQDAQMTSQFVRY